MFSLFELNFKNNGIWFVCKKIKLEIVKKSKKVKLEIVKKSKKVKLEIV